MWLVLTPLPPQGTPLKYDAGAASSGSKKHDVRSIIGSPGRTFPAVHPLDVMADVRALERACYEESLKGRSGAGSGSGGSITRGAPVIVPELGKPRQSPLAYEDHATSFAGPLPRGSPGTTREPTPRLQEGAWGAVRVGVRVTGGLPSRETARCPRSAQAGPQGRPLSHRGFCPRSGSGTPPPPSPFPACSPTPPPAPPVLL